MSPRARFTATLTLLAGLLFAPTARARITFQFDYTYDTNNFFNPTARAALERAALTYSDRLRDNLAAITPPTANSWNQRFVHPGTGDALTPVLIPDQTVPANTLKIYVGGRNLGGAVGVGGPGGYVINSTNATFISAVQYRGQPAAQGASPTDIGNWGGTIAFDNTVAWNFDLAGPAAGKNDFLTIATHELAHVLGLGTSPSWKTYLTGVVNQYGNTQYVGPFRGPKSAALYGANVPLQNPPAQTAANAPLYHAAHFAPGVSSQVGTPGGPSQETLTDPDITIGTRKRLTLLDWAALDDIGWDLAMPGDANADGLVDFNDLVSLAQNYNTATGQARWIHGDFTEDGHVDFSDLVLLAQGYNAASAPPASTLAADPTFAADWALAQAHVPEPATLSLLALGLSLMRPRRARS
jgi:hypothetical protein